MEKEPIVASGFQVQSIILTETSFSRQTQIDFQSGTIENKFDIDTELPEGASASFGVALTVNLYGLQNEKEVYAVKTKMVGVFTGSGDPALNFRDFTSVNAPAIIFPFIREHIAGLCVKGGIGNVLLPPINFTITSK